MSLWLNAPRITPWKNWDEWFSVKHDLFDFEVGKVQNALDRISLWRHRGKIPHAIDATAILVEVLSKDSLNLDGVRSDMELRLWYSMAIVRAVNGMVDAAQKGMFADSILSIASRIDLPAWIVEIRHDCTHNNLANIRVLRNGANYLVSFFKDNYWDKQAEKILWLRELCELICCYTDTAVCEWCLSLMNCVSRLCENESPGHLNQFIKKLSANTCEENEVLLESRKYVMLLKYIASSGTFLSDFYIPALIRMIVSTDAKYFLCKELCGSAYIHHRWLLGIGLFIPAVCEESFENIPNSLVLEQMNCVISVGMLNELARCMSGKDITEDEILVLCTKFDMFLSCYSIVVPCYGLSSTNIKNILIQHALGNLKQIISQRSFSSGFCDKLIEVLQNICIKMKCHFDFDISNAEKVAPANSWQVITPYPY